MARIPDASTQFNIVDTKVLRDAHQRLEKYHDQQVRVAGYSAFWTDLPKGTQDSIIARTEHGLYDWFPEAHVSRF